MLINEGTLVETIISNGLALDKYKKIIDDVKHTDVSNDTEFQRTFNHFYKVRRNENWRKIYYELFEDSKSNSVLKFEEILVHLYRETHQIEPSFSSKLLATLNPDMPIWDQYVLRNLGLELKGSNKEERLCNAVILYDNIIEWYKEFLGTDNAKECLHLFRSATQNYQWLTDTKIIDYIICGMRQ